LSNYRASAEKGRRGIAEHKAIADFAVKRAKLVIPKAAKDVINEWSGSILKANNAEIDKKKAVASTTKDVGKGPQGTTSVAGAQATNKPRHLSDVYAEIENRILGR